MRDDNVSQTRVSKGAESGDVEFGEVMANIVALPTAIDSAKNALLSKDKSVKDVLKKAFKNFPESAFEEQVEGIDVITSYAPEWASKNPSTAAFAGVAMDLLDPISFAATWAKLPVTGGTAIRKLGDSIVDSGLEKFVKKNIKTTKKENVPVIIDYIKKNKLVDKVDDPDTLIPQLKKKVNLTGEKLRTTTKAAAESGAPKIDKNEIARAIISKTRLLNSDRISGQTVKEEKVVDFINKTLKPTKKVKELKQGLPPVIPAKPSQIPVTNIDSELSNLTSEVAKRKTLSSMELPPPFPPSEKTVEEMLEEIGVLQAQKKAGEATNKEIAREAARAESLYKSKIDETKPKLVDKIVPDVVDVNSAWELKVNLRNQLSEAQKKAARTGKESGVNRIKGLIDEVDERVATSLEGIELPEGNAADIYRTLNKTYGAEKETLDFLDSVQNVSWKGGEASSKAINEIPTATVSPGWAAARAARDFISGSMGNRRMKAGRILQGPTTANTAAQFGQETVEEFFPDANPSMEPTFITEDGMEISPDQLDMGGRSPQSEGVIEMDASELDPSQIEPPVSMGEEAAKENIVNALAPLPYSMSPYVNEQVLNTPLPRSTDRLMQNPTVLKAKLSQVAPQYLPHLEDTMKNDPEGLRKAAPKIAEMYPAIFERDDYGMFDGKIVNPEMQTKFLADLSQDEGLDSITKATMAMKIRRGEPI